MLKVGIFAVRYVGLGDGFGKDDAQINRLTPMVEFYDRRFGRDRWMGRGQFIVRLKTEYLFLPQCWHGIALDERVPMWSLDRAAVCKVRDYINEMSGVRHACLL